MEKAEGGKMTYSFECPTCFLQFGEDFDFDEIPDRTTPRQCDYCKARPYFLDKPMHTSHSIRLLKRRIEVLNSTSLNRFPTIMQHLFQHVTLQDAEDL